MDYIILDAVITILLGSVFVVVYGAVFERE